MQALLRRRFLGAVVAGTVTAAAGCTDTLGGGGGQADLPVYSDWLAADLFVDQEEGILFHIDLDIFTEEWPERVQEDLGLEEIADEFGVDPDDLDGFLIVEPGAGFGSQGGTILTGSFDQEALVEELSMGVETTEYGGYDVLFDSIAVGSEAIIIGGGYETFIDAKNGDEDRIADVDDEWDAALRNVSGAGFSGVMLDPTDEFIMMGIAMDADGDDLRLRAHAHFADEETAEAELEAVETETASEFVDEEGEITDVRLEGSVVVVEAIVYDFNW